MARHRSSLRKKDDFAASPKPSSDPFQPRPFADPAVEEVPHSPANSAPPILDKLVTPPPRSAPIQAKLTIGEPGDRYEQEADRVASQVVQQIHAPQTKAAVQRESIEDDEELQMKPDSLQRESIEEDDELQMRPATEAVEGGPASEALESAIHQARGSGQALDPHLQRQMGQAMGADFSGVTIHTDSQADQLNHSIQAKAFTTGQDIFFRQGAYQPSSQSGQELIAHELTHVVQQNSGINHQEVPTSRVKPSNQDAPQVSQKSSIIRASLIQRERFIGNKAKHHLHIEINQDHYKFAKDDGSRIEIGKNGNYKLDQLIVARNHLVENGYSGDDAQACIDWLENECQTHSDWDESIGYQPSWEVEEVEENKHVEGLLDYGESYGYRRADFENTLMQAKADVLKDALGYLKDGNYYGSNEDGEEATEPLIEKTINDVTLLELLPQWSGFPDKIYSKSALAEYFKRIAKDFLRQLLFDTFPLASGKYEDG